VNGSKEIKNVRYRYPEPKKKVINIRCCIESDPNEMVGNPQGRDRGLETLEKADAD
jgi:hypothetical protein